MAKLRRHHTSDQVTILPWWSQTPVRPASRLAVNPHDGGPIENIQSSVQTLIFRIDQSPDPINFRLTHNENISWLPSLA